MMERLSRRHVVLLGIGHTNAHLLRVWRMDAPPDTDLTCLSNFPVVTYSGMLPAVLAQQKPQEAMEIDLVQLCESASARLITDPVIGIDHDRREIQFADRPAIPFDFLSIGIGSVPTVHGVEIEGDSLVPIKPMQTFLQRLSSNIESCLTRSAKDHLNVVIVGSGVAGVEVTMCLPPFLASVTDVPCKLNIVTRSPSITPDLKPKTRRVLAGELDRRGVTVTCGRAVTRILHDSVVLDDETQLPADLVIWATGASPAPLVAKLGLSLDSGGFVETDETLQSTSTEGVFAVGDTGGMRGHHLAKAGVYAVRQGPVLWDNLLRFLDGRPLVPYRPQRSFMKLINLGNGSAVGQWRGLTFSGRWVMNLKQRIDSGFMSMFRVDPSMGMADEDTTLDDELRRQCRGCGCKLDPETLSNVISLGQHARYEDAAEIDTGDGNTIVASTDFFSAPFRDPFLSGRVAALHSSSDVIASGGLPIAALANVVLPPGDPASQRRTLADLLAGASRELNAMGANLVGGHTIIGPRMEIGFTVIGKPIGSSPIRKGNLRVGDRLVLTKPLGIGVLLAAHMRCQCKAHDYMQAVSAMLQQQHAWAGIANACGIIAATDITGFGLAGHLLEMLDASQMSAVIDLDSIPALPGAVDALANGIQSTLAPGNRRLDSRLQADDTCRSRPEYELLFDPQTCGGFLLAVAEEQLARLVELANEKEMPEPVLIGTVERSVDPNRPLRIARRGREGREAVGQ